MNKLRILLVLFIVHSCTLQSPNLSIKEKHSQTLINQDFEAYLPNINQEDLMKHLFIFASDSFGGRGTGQENQSLSIDYLKKQYSDLALSIAPGLESYQQDFNLYTTQYSHCRASSKGKTLNNSFVYSHYLFPSITISEGEWVYVGYGIDEESYSDYNNINVNNQFALVRYGEAQNESGNFILSQSDVRSNYSKNIESIKLKAKIAKKQGVKALLMVVDENSINNPMLVEENKINDFYSFSEQILFAIDGFPNRLESLLDLDLPVFFITNNAFHDLAKNDINNLNVGSRINLPLDISYSAKYSKSKTSNVLAYIKGEDLANEVVVISAHLDHLGTENGKVYPGADDDGSGTVALLEIAQAFYAAQVNGHTPKRSVLFLHVSGEELGLLGSEFYTKHPAFALSNTFANLNVDMIGRVDKDHQNNDNYIYLIGSNRISQQLHKLSEQTNEHLGVLELDYKYNAIDDPNQFYYRSDHYNFAKHDIPVIFYFNGTHADYHKPSDTVDKIRFDLLEKRAKLIFATAWQLANTNQPLKN